MTVLGAILVFISTAVADAVWAVYIQAAAKRRVLLAASTSALIVLLGSISITEYFISRWMVLPAAAGAFVGSYASLVRGHNEER